MRLGALVLLALALAPAAARAAEPAARTWQAEPLEPFAWGRVTSTGPGRTVLVTTGHVPSESRYATRARVRGADGRLGAAQELADEVAELGLDGSPAGGAVLATYDSGAGSISLRELLPDAGAFGPPTVLPGHLYGPPEVTVDDEGRAIVAMMEYDQERRRVVAVSRDEPGGFGAPEPVTEWVDELSVTDARLAPDGTALVAYVNEHGRFVAVRPPGGAWSASGPLGGPTSASPYDNQLAVGMDGRGAVVAAWTEAGPFLAQPLRVAFRAPGSDAFGAPRDLGMTAHSGKFGLGVSKAGEVILLGGTEDEQRGIWAAFGSTHGERLGERGMLAGLMTYARLATNSRGDATIVFDGIHPGELMARSRRAGGSFGPMADVQAATATGAMLDAADLDPFGNAHALWRTNDGAAVSADGPLLTEAPEPEPATGPLPPVLYMDIYEEAGIWMPGQPYDKYYPPYTGPGSSPATADTRAPSVTLARVTAKPGARRLALKLRCSERCSVRARAYRGKRAGRTTRATLAPRVQRRIRVRVPRGSAKALRVRVSVRDAAGNARTVSRRVRRR